jgi:hypothetical protein
MSAKLPFDRGIGIQTGWRHISTSPAYSAAVFSALGSDSLAARLPPDIQSPDAFFVLIVQLSRGNQR